MLRRGKCVGGGGSVYLEGEVRSGRWKLVHPTPGRRWRKKVVVVGGGGGSAYEEEEVLWRSNLTSTRSRTCVVGVENALKV